MKYEKRLAVDEWIKHIEKQGVLIEEVKTLDDDRFEVRLFDRCGFHKVVMQVFERELVDDDN